MFEIQYPWDRLPSLDLFYVVIGQRLGKQEVRFFRFNDADGKYRHQFELGDDDRFV